MDLLAEDAGPTEHSSKKLAFVTSVRQVYQKSKKRTYIVAGASDGAIHWFTNDNLKVNGKSSVFFLDRYFRKDAKAVKEGRSFEAGFQRENIHSDCTFLGTEKGANLVVSITSKSKFFCKRGY